MLMTPDKKHDRSRRLLEKVDLIERRVQVLQDGIKRDEKILDMYEDPLWSKFVSTVVEPEKSRLAARRMTIPIESEHDHILITGQYMQAELFSASRDTIIQTINESMDELEQKRAQLEAAKTELGKLDA